MASTSARKCSALRSRAFEDFLSGGGGHGILHLLDKSKDVGERRGVLLRVLAIGIISVRRCRTSHTVRQSELIEAT